MADKGKIDVDAQVASGKISHRSRRGAGLRKRTVLFSEKSATAG